MTGTKGSGVVRLIDMVFPGYTNHHGTLFGGVALAHMDKVAVLAATREARAVMVMAASDRVDFIAPIRTGDMTELTARGRSSVLVDVELESEALLTGERRHAARASFTMVAVDEAGRPKPF